MKKDRMAYMKEYHQRPKVKKREKEYRQKPDVKEKRRKERNKPENKKKIREYFKEYYKNPDVKKKIREYKQRLDVKMRDKEYENRPEVKEKRKVYAKNYLEKEENRIKNKKYCKEYRIKHDKKPEVRKRRRERYHLRVKNDVNFHIKIRLRDLIRKSLQRYLKKGDIRKSGAYGIKSWLIIEHLKPFPENLSKYHIDHIRPLCTFDLTDPEEVKKAFAPENHQWLTTQENLSKGGKWDSV